MGMTIQPQNQLNFTDGTGCFREGMTMDEARGARSLFDGILRERDALKEFWRIDEDMDNVLSHEEISNELKRNIEKKFSAFKSDTVWTVFCVANSFIDIKAKMPTMSKLWMIGGFANMAFGIIDLYKMYKYTKRLAQGHN